MLEDMLLLRARLACVPAVGQQWSQHCAGVPIQLRCSGQITGVFVHLLIEYIPTYWQPKGGQATGSQAKKASIAALQALEAVLLLERERLLKQRKVLRLQETLQRLG
jgi:hypothetical protein